MFACSESPPTTPSPILRLSPDTLRSHPGSLTIDTLILEGAGSLSDQSLGFRFPNLKTLHLIFTPDVTSLPNDLALCSQIQDIQIYGTSIQQMPTILGSLPIQTLRLEHNPFLETIPDIYSPIQKIHIANNPLLTRIPDTIGQPETLQSVSLANNQLNRIPDSIGDYNHITDLNLDGNNLSELPSSIGNLTALQAFDASNNLFTTLPPELGALPNLQSLALHHLPNLQTLPAFSNPQSLSAISVLDCPNMKIITSDILLASNLIELKIQATGIHTLPSQLFTLPRLHAVKIRMNPSLQKLPSDIGFNDTIRILSMDQNNIEVIPTDFGKLTRLETLSLDENNISILPKELCSLPRLQELSLSENQLPQLCENLASLETLRMLNINSNPIYELPSSLAKLQNLEYINLWDVPLQSEPKELYELNKLQVLCLNPPDHYPHPRVIRNLKKRLQSRVDILSTDG